MSNLNAYQKRIHQKLTGQCTKAMTVCLNERRTKDAAVFWFEHAVNIVSAVSQRRKQLPLLSFAHIITGSSLAGVGNVASRLCQRH